MQCGLELVFPHLDEINKPETSPAILALPCWQRNGSTDVSLTVLPPTLLPCLLVLFLGVQPAQEVSSKVANSSVWLLLCVNSENHSQLNKQHATRRMSYLPQQHSWSLISEVRFKLAVAAWASQRASLTSLGFCQGSRVLFSSEHPSGDLSAEESCVYSAFILKDYNQVLRESIRHVELSILEAIGVRMLKQT